LAGCNANGDWTCSLVGGPLHGDVAAIETGGILQFFYRVDDTLRAGWRDRRGNWSYVDSNRPRNVRSDPLVIPANPKDDDNLVWVFYRGFDSNRLLMQDFRWNDGWGRLRDLSGSNDDADFAFSAIRIPRIVPSGADDVAVFYTNSADGSVSFRSLNGRYTVKLPGGAFLTPNIAVSLIPGIPSNTPVSRGTLQYFYNDSKSQSVRSRWREADEKTWKPDPITEEDSVISCTGDLEPAASIVTATVLQYPPKKP
jgi:hypothetical protein